MLKLVNSSRAALLDYVALQLRHLFPDNEVGVRDKLDGHLDEALARLLRCIDAVRMWRAGEFDYLHSSQYAMFLYFLSNTVWRHSREQRLCTKLFYLNKALNGIDCFYEIEMPEIFFIGHSVGIVLAKATYGNYLVLYQSSTVGKNHGVAPVIGERVVMYPNSAVIGGCEVRDGSVISQGVSVINRQTPGNCVVYRGEAGDLIFKPLGRNVIEDIFRQ